MSNEEKNEKFFAPVGDRVEALTGEETNTDVMKTGAEDVEGRPVQEVQSYCMNCSKNGVTRMLLTKIPYFKEIILMSFECPHCGFKNSEIQSAAQIQDKGSKYILKIEKKEDFNRQVVKSESANCNFVELETEIPPKKGQFITVEGLLTEMIEDLESDQEKRKEIQPEIYDKIDAYIKKVKSCINGDEGCLPLTVVVDDPAGNSWIEYVPGEPSHKWSKVEYFRTPEQNLQLGLIDEGKYADIKRLEKEREENTTEQPLSTGFASDSTDIENFANEVQVFKATCPTCYAPCDTHMKTVNIPHFKDVIIMSTVCDHCGYKSNEVKTGGAIPEKGKRVVLKCDDPEDLKRDILKSETCHLVVPELNMDLTPGTLGGRFTTLEGLLRQVHDELNERVFTQTSDSMDPKTKASWESFFAKLQQAIDGKIPFTLMMEDPLAASYVQNVYAPDVDPNMASEDYERTDEENESLGLNDMVV
ncbi:zinc finger-containing protein [Saccharomycopsis crataegensis]|uniref:Zinc finger-containing protein n=1 Tax=Saccharomycopsis crataegensis TaxID=43959 RepID=A0AAV5QIB5_9ASCO|nr:zinc finger-containing protein [Saccharomycopsis crataegensis]